MIRVRFALCAVAIGALALAACKKEGGTSKEAGAALNYLPKDAKVVLGVNLSKLGSAKILEKYKAEMLQNAPEDFKEMKDACGLDPFTDFSSLVVGMVDNRRMVIVVSGSFTKDKIESCLTKVAEKEGKTFEAKDDGKLRVYSGLGETVYAHWTSDSSVVLTSDEGGGAALLNEILGGAKLGDGDVMSMVKSTKTSAGIWAAGKLDASMTGGLPVGDEISGVALTIDASDTIDIKAMAQLSDEKKASEMAMMASMGLSAAAGANPQLAAIEPVLKKVKVEADGKAVKVGVSLTAGDLDTIKSATGGMMR